MALCILISDTKNEYLLHDRHDKKEVYGKCQADLETPFIDGKNAKNDNLELFIVDGKGHEV